MDDKECSAANFQPGAVVLSFWRIYEDRAPLLLTWRLLTQEGAEAFCRDRMRRSLADVLARPNPSSLYARIGGNIADRLLSLPDQRKRHDAEGFLLLHVTAPNELVPLAWATPLSGLDRLAWEWEGVADKDFAGWNLPSESYVLSYWFLYPDGESRLYRWSLLTQDGAETFCVSRVGRSLEELSGGRPDDRMYRRIGGDILARLLALAPSHKH